jgi:hypothetical protein
MSAVVVQPISSTPRGISVGGPTSVVSAPTKRLDQRSCDPRVEHVPDDRHVEPVQPAERLVHREQVEQRLRGMLVLAVPGVHDMGVGHVGDELRRSDVWVPDDDYVRVVRAEGQRGVLERLALVHGRPGGAQRHRVGRKPLRGEVEARERARGGLVEEVDHEASAQRRQLLHLPIQRPGHRARGAEDPVHVGALEV